MDGVVSALGGADRPGRPGISRTRGERVVRSLAEGPADRMDWREVDNIEAHRGRSLQPLVGCIERAGDPLLVLLIPAHPERGKNSYHELNSAARRSTKIG